MKYSSQPKVSSKTVLNNLEASAMNYSGKVTVTNLPDFVIKTGSKNLTEESEITSTDFEDFQLLLLAKLRQTLSRAQKNRLYRITLLVGNFDESVIPLLENAPSIVTGTPLLSTEKLIDGGVIRVTAGLT